MRFTTRQKELRLQARYFTRACIRHIDYSHHAVDRSDVLFYENMTRYYAEQAAHRILEAHPELRG